MLNESRPATAIRVEVRIFLQRNFGGGGIVFIDDGLWVSSIRSTSSDNRLTVNAIVPTFTRFGDYCLSRVFRVKISIGGPIAGSPLSYAKADMWRFAGRNGCSVSVRSSDGCWSNITDPTFPPPEISGFETYGHPWATKAADLEIVRLEFFRSWRFWIDETVTGYNYRSDL